MCYERITDMRSGYAYLPYPPALRDAVECVTHEWVKFCLCSEDLKRHFRYAHIGDVGVGYELKNANVATYDQKEDFHYALCGKDQLFMQAADFPWTRAFVQAAHDVAEEVAQVTYGIGIDIERRLDIPEFGGDVLAGSKETVIRFVHYFHARNEGDEIASAHADKAGFTLQLSGDPGLQYLNAGRTWRELPIRRDELLILPGMRMQYRTKGAIKALYHRRVATAESALLGCVSIVAFVHPANTPAYNKRLAGRLQEAEPGFNYDMPFEEFAKLFA